MIGIYNVRFQDLNLKNDASNYPHLKQVFLMNDEDILKSIY